MFTVALIGPDGAGKTTVARWLEQESDLPVRYLYMGVSADSSNRLLPTTRIARAIKRQRGAPPDTAGPPDPVSATKVRPKRLDRRVLASCRAGLRLTNRLGEEWARQLAAWKTVRQGTIVVFDRHFFFDYYAYDIAGGPGRSTSRRVHGYLLAHAYPKPDLVIYLDAPADVLLARKGEGTIETLERRRSDYLALEQTARRWAVVDATLPLEEVKASVGATIAAVLEERRASSRGGRRA
jgi:thymidylate kinase